MPILSYAARHDYSDIVDIAAPLVVVRLTLSETLPILPSNFIMPWVRRSHGGPHHDDTEMKSFRSNILKPFIQIQWTVVWRTLSRSLVPFSFRGNLRPFEYQPERTR